MKSSEGNRLNAATQNKTKKLHCLKLESFPCVKIFAYLGLFAEVSGIPVYVHKFNRCRCGIKQQPGVREFVDLYAFTGNCC